MPKPRKSVLGKGELHFITCSSHLHQAKLGAEKHRDLFCQLLEQLRAKYRFNIIGYVIMPSAFHVLLSEPETETVETLILTLRQRYQRRYNTSARSDEPAWEKAIADKHIVGADQIVSCLSFMHQAPVKAKLAEKPTDWEWSSARRYAGLPEGVVTLDPTTDPRAVVGEADG
jgi:putative transposase